MKKVVDNCKALAEELMRRDVKLLTNGTDNHLILIDLRDRDISGQELENRLKQVGIVTNKNAVPFDTKNKKTTSGLRIGTAAVTSRGLNEEDMADIANIISICLLPEEEYKNKLLSMQETVSDICSIYPLYKENI
jgi:glycine hydroxymethyltransferase